MAVALLDTNVLVHAAYQRAPLHIQARRILDRALGQRAKYCIAPQNLVEFAAVVTRKKLVHEPLPADQLARFVRILYGSRNLKKIYSKRATVMRAIREGAALGISGPIWYDLFLAMTMRDAGVSMIVTEDITHYQRFPFVTALTIDEEASKEQTGIEERKRGPGCLSHPLGRQPFHKALCPSARRKPGEVVDAQS